MSDRLPALIAALVVLATVPMAGLAAQTDGTATDAPTETNASATPPGAQLAGVVGVGEAEIDAEVDDRAFGIRLAQAETDEARADVVADRLDDVDRRLATLEAARDAMEQARENGSMSEGEYRARAAKLAAESRSAERAANQSADVAAGLPPALLESKGINASAIRMLAERAGGLTGPDVAEIARSIAGENVGGPAAGDHTPFGDDGAVPDDAGPGDASPDDAGPEKDPADDTVTEAGGEGDPGEDVDGNVTDAPADGDAPDDVDGAADGGQNDGA